jgi:hypothetical protein
VQTGGKPHSKAVYAMRGCIRDTQSRSGVLQHDLQKAATSLQGLQQRSGKGVTMVLGGVLSGSSSRGKCKNVHSLREEVLEK